MAAEEIRNDLQTLRQDVANERTEVRTKLDTQEAHIATLEARIEELEQGGDISPSFAQELRTSIGEIRQDVAGIYAPEEGGEEGE